MTPAALQLRSDDLDRLHDLEDSHRNVCAQLAANTERVAANTSQLQGIERRMGEGFASLGEKFEQFSVQLTATIQDQAQRLASLETTRTQNRQRLVAVGGWVASIAAVVVGAFLLVRLGLK